VNVRELRNGTAKNVCALETRFGAIRRKNVYVSQTKSGSRVNVCASLIVIGVKS